MADQDRKFQHIDERLDLIEAAALDRKSDVDRLDALFSLIGVLSDPSRFAAAVEAFRQREAAAKAAEARIAKVRQQVDEQAYARRSRLTDEDAALLTRLVAAQDEAVRLHGEFARQKELRAAWERFAENDAVQDGSTSPRRPAIHKARRAHGLPDDWQEDPDVPFDEAPPPTVPSIFPDRERRAERPSRRAR